MAFVEYEVKQKFALNNADISDDPNAFADAGYVLNNNDYIIDIDDLDKETIKKLIFEFDIQTQTVWTERGVHFYFKKPEGFTRGANRVSPLG
ncbi:MAG TPA: DNA primase, partial [Tissierellaceae bacterium]